MKNVLVFFALAPLACTEAAPPKTMPAPAPSPASAPAPLKGVSLEDATLKIAKGPALKEAQAMVDAYMVMKDALVKSDSASARHAAVEVRARWEALAKVDVDDAHRALRDAHVALARTALSVIADEQKNLGEQRLAFAPLSEATYAAAKTFGAKATVQYCPMARKNKGAYWLAKEDAIKNPYFGDAMLSCGEVRARM